MPGLTIGWEYLTGYCVATDSTSRQRAEWPPQPGRVFMALAAAWFETGEETDEGKALRWLEKLGDPQLVLPPNDEVSRRDVVTVFVPVNDTAGPSAALVQSAPSITRSKQPRTFPSVWVGDAPCFLHWPDATAADVGTYRSALGQLCGKVTRIGHSSSLVRMWLAKDTRTSSQSEIWIPDNELAELQARRVSEGTLDLLDRQFNRRGREEHDRLTREIESLTSQKKTIRGKGAPEQKAAIDRQIDILRKSLTLVDPRLIRPKLGLWSGYRRRESEPPAPTQHTDFDSDLLMLTQINGPRLPLASTLAITQALRFAVMKHSGVQPPPPWVSGHLDDDSQPLRDGRQHLACIPLPFVGTDFADGHLLGTAIVFPRAVSRPERGRVLGQFVLEPSGQPRPIMLTLGSLGVWTLVKRDWSESRQALTPGTWTAHPRGATTWATVTPVVLDRFPKFDPISEQAEWRNEVAGIIATACRRFGLPNPVEMDFGTTSWHRGIPRASVKRRPLRGHSGSVYSTTSVGDGFPTYPAKGSNGPRPQLHVCLRFAEPVVGPIVLGAGRFLGYGLCKPLWGGVSR